MPKIAMVGTQLLVPPTLKKRAEALASRTGRSVAEVWRAAIEGKGLRALEREYERAATEEEQ